MRLSLGLVLSILLHAAFLAYAVFWAGTADVRVNMDRPVYTVDLVSLAPPPPAPVVEVSPKPASEADVPVVEAAPESAVEVKETPVVEAKPEPEPEPKVEEISSKKVKKKTVIKKKEEKPKPKPKPRPKPKPKKTAEQLRKEALAAAKARVKKQELKKQQALKDELEALKKKEGSEVYAHGARPGGVEGGEEGGQVGGVPGGVGSGLSEVYALIVGSAIKKNWRYPSFAGEANLLAVVEIVLEADGRIVSSKVLEPSGNPEFDNSTLRAIRETEYVERPRTDRDRVLRINFNSQELSE